MLQAVLTDTLEDSANEEAVVERCSPRTASILSTFLYFRSLPVVEMGNLNSTTPPPGN
jgi:hypothetical protein